MGSFLTRWMRHPKQRMIWLILSIISTVTLSIFVLFLPWMTNVNNLTISLWQYDTMLSAYVIWVTVFTSIFFLTTALHPDRKTVEDLSIVQAIVRILPVPPLVGAWIFTILPLVQTHDQAYYFTLGSDFMIANYMEFIDAVSVDDIVQVGEGLTYAIGLYLLFAFLILSTGYYLMIVIWSVRPEHNSYVASEDIE